MTLCYQHADGSLLSHCELGSETVTSEVGMCFVCVALCMSVVVVCVFVVWVMCVGGDVSVDLEPGDVG